MLVFLEKKIDFTLNFLKVQLKIILQSILLIKSKFFFNQRKLFSFVFIKTLRFSKIFFMQNSVRKFIFDLVFIQKFFYPFLNQRHFQNLVYIRPVFTLNFEKQRNKILYFLRVNRR